MSRSLAPLALLLALLGCSAETMMESSDAGYADGGGSDGAGGSGWAGCFSDPDCPAGLVCTLGVCVLPDDGKPPETEVDASFLRPVAAGPFVLALSPDSDSAAIIDPVTLSIRAIVLPEEPIAAAGLPGESAALVLSREGRALSRLEVSAAELGLRVQRTPRRFSALSAAPDGAFALLWTPEGTTPDFGAEGVVAIVKVSELGDEGAGVDELALGRRHTNVFFRVEEGVARDAVILGKEELAIVPLRGDDALTPVRLRLPAGFDEILTREAAASPDGGTILLRALATPELLVVNVRARALSTLPLPAIATDLELSRDGRRAVAALRAAESVAIIPLPEALTDAAAITILPTPGIVPGQVEVADDGRRALVFSTAEPSETIGVLSLEGAPSLEVLDVLQKWIRAIGLTTDGTRAVVLHRPDPDSTIADPYERAVDRDEGYSLLDVDRGIAQLKRTGAVAPREIVLAADGRHAAVVLGTTVSNSTVEVLDLQTLVTDSLVLAGVPEYAGALATDDPALVDRIWVTQIHPAGRISFVELARRAVRTVTGYELNADVE